MACARVDCRYVKSRICSIAKASHYSAINTQTWPQYTGKKPSSAWVGGRLCIKTIRMLKWPLHNGWLLPTSRPKYNLFSSWKEYNSSIVCICMNNQWSHLPDSTCRCSKIWDCFQGHSNSWQRRLVMVGEERVPCTLKDNQTGRTTYKQPCTFLPTATHSGDKQSPAIIISSPLSPWRQLYLTSRLKEVLPSAEENMHVVMLGMELYENSSNCTVFGTSTARYWLCGELGM